MELLHPIEHQWLFSILLNSFLVILLHRFPLLTREGWIHSAALGVILFGCLGWQGWLSVVIYLILGSAVTKLGLRRKKELGIAEARDGRRGPENVWGSSSTGAFLALLICLPLGYERLFLIGFASSFAAKLADTFGSEIGKRWGRNAVLITNFRTVTPGTEGAISLEGTLASALGSLVMAIVMSSLLIISGEISFYLVVFTGLLATLIESLLGALLQNRMAWVSNELINCIQTSLAAFISIVWGLLFL